MAQCATSRWSTNIGHISVSSAGRLGIIRLLIENEVRDQRTLIYLLLLLFIKVNTMAQVASLWLWCPWHSLLRKNNLGLVLFRVDVLYTLLLVLTGSLDKAGAISRFS